MVIILFVIEKDVSVYNKVGFFFFFFHLWEQEDVFFIGVIGF